MHRACGARQVIDLVNLQKDGLDNIVPDQLKVGFVEQVRNILLASREHVINANNMVASLDLYVQEEGPVRMRAVSSENCAVRVPWSNFQARTKYSQRWLPTNPAPPVTSTRLRSMRGLALTAGLSPSMDRASDWRKRGSGDRWREAREVGERERERVRVCEPRARHHVR